MDAKQYRFYDRSYVVIRKIVGGIIRKKVNFKGDAIPCDVGPMFILCNHNTDFDFILLMSESKTPLDFVGTETMSRMGGFVKLVLKTFHPILHDKGSKGTATLRQITERIKDGRSVLLFPEGNRSFDGKTGSVSPAIGKIAKMTGATLVIYKLTGGYFTTPRWGRGIRRGRMEGQVINVITAERLKEMPPQQVQKLIEDGLMTDAYMEQEKRPVSFKSRFKAEYLETLLFICPDCKKTGTLRSKGNNLSCSCGYKLSMDAEGYLHSRADKLSITDLVSGQKKCLKEKISASYNDKLWEDNVHATLLTTGNETVKEEEMNLSVKGEGLYLGDLELTRDMIGSIDIVQRNRLTIHVKKSDVRYEFTGDKTFNAVKYLTWYEISFDGTGSDS